MPRCPLPRGSGAEAGFTLVEVLVTLVILCIGLLGAVGLQTAALQANAQTRYQVVATGLASELAEIMRGNHQVALGRMAADNPYLLRHRSGAPSAPPVDCQTGACTGVTTADRINVAHGQAFDWLERTIAGLPSPRIEVCFDSAPFDAGTGLPHWACDGTGDTLAIKLAWVARDTADGLVLDADRPMLVMPVTAGSR